MKKLAIVTFITLVLSTIVAGLTAAGPQSELTISAAVSLKNAFQELARLFEARNKDVKILLNFGASGDLVTQIEGGAPIDVFASAALKDMDELDKAGLIQSGTKTSFATNSIVLIVPSSSRTSFSSFQDLKKSDVKKIAMGNPTTTPVGRYADEVLRFYKLSDEIKDKLVFVENVRQALDYVARGEVDAGIVYSTDAVLKQHEAKVVMTAPEASHKPAVYPLAVVKGTKNEKTSKAFISFVVSDQGRAVLEKYGFKPPR